MIGTADRWASRSRVADGTHFLNSVGARSGIASNWANHPLRPPTLAQRRSPLCGPVHQNHRNRAALHALAVATDDFWPFPVTSRREGQVDRLNDSGDYLHMPLGRWAALMSRVMPEPTRQQPSQKTYRYHFDPEELQCC